MQAHISIETLDNEYPLTEQLISFLLAQIRSVNINNRESDCGAEERIESKIKNSWGCCFVFIFIYLAPAYFIVCSQKMDLHIASASFLLPSFSHLHGTGLKFHEVFLRELLHDIRVFKNKQ